MLRREKPISVAILNAEAETVKELVQELRFWRREPAIGSRTLERSWRRIKKQLGIDVEEADRLLELAGRMQ